MKRMTHALMTVAALTLVAGSAISSGVRADEADAKNLLKAMSDYLAAQKIISFAYDATLEVVTKDQQKLALRVQAQSFSTDPTRSAPRVLADL